MNKDKEVTLKIPLYDLECIGDGLEARLETWKNTLRVMRGEEVPTFDVEDGSTEREAAKMVAQYERLTEIVWAAVNAHRAAPEV